MRHFIHHAADGRRVLTFDDLVEPCDTHSLDHGLVLLGRTDLRRVVLDLDGLLGRCCHVQSSSTVLPRSAAISLRSRNPRSAAKVALITLCGLAVPNDLVSTFCTPTDCITA